MHIINFRNYVYTVSICFDVPTLALDIHCISRTTFDVSRSNCYQITINEPVSPPHDSNTCTITMQLDCLHVQLLQNNLSNASLVPRLILGTRLVKCLSGYIYTKLMPMRNLSYSSQAQHCSIVLPACSGILGYDRKVYTKGE